MAVVESKSIIKLLKDNNLLSDSYDESRLENDINTTFVPINYANVSELIKIIPAITPAQIKNLSDLNALSLKVDKAEEYLKTYRDFDETLLLKSVKDIAANAHVVIAKIIYCRNYGYPYCDDNGEIFSEVIYDLSYLRRFKKHVLNKGIDLYYADDYRLLTDDLEEDKLSELIALIQTKSLKYFHKLVSITEQNEKYFESLLEQENTDINSIAYIAFSTLKNNPDNSFIDLDLINNTYNFANNDFTMDRRNGQR